MNCLTDQELFDLLVCEPGSLLYEKGNAHIAECSHCFSEFLSLQQIHHFHENHDLLPLCSEQDELEELDFVMLENSEQVLWVKGGKNQWNIGKELLQTRSVRDSGQLSIHVQKLGLEFYIFCQDNITHFLSMQMLEVLQILVDGKIQYLAGCKAKQIIKVTKGSQYKIIADSKELSFKLYSPVASG